MRAFCDACDRAVEAEGEWPGRCGECAEPIVADPLTDVVAPGLKVLFVGINPGAMTARTGVHFANPRNLFWRALHEGGFTPRRLEPGEQGAILDLGLGITNVVTRATPGSADVTAEDVRRGRARLRGLVAELQPDWLAFVGKQAYNMATGAKRSEHGPQSGRVLGARAFVLPSTSPANAGVPPEEKVAWFRRLAEAAGLPA